MNGDLCIILLGGVLIALGSLIMQVEPATGGGMVFGGALALASGTVAGIAKVNDKVRKLEQQVNDLNKRNKI